MNEKILCGFCGKPTEPRRTEEGDRVLYWCGLCDSLISAYTLGGEGHLKFGKLFRKYSSWEYKPSLPRYVKRKRRQ